MSLLVSFLFMVHMILLFFCFPSIVTCFKKVNLVYKLLVKLTVFYLIFVLFLFSNQGRTCLRSMTVSLSGPRTGPSSGSGTQPGSQIKAITQFSRSRSQYFLELDSSTGSGFDLGAEPMDQNFGPVFWLGPLVLLEFDSFFKNQKFGFKYEISGKPIQPFVGTALRVVVLATRCFFNQIHSSKWAASTPKDPCSRFNCFY